MYVGYVAYLHYWSQGVGNLRGGKLRGPSASFQCKVLDNQGQKCDATEPRDNMFVERKQSLMQMLAWSLISERKVRELKTYRLTAVYNFVYANFCKS